MSWNIVINVGDNINSTLVPVLLGLLEIFHGNQFAVKTALKNAFSG